MLASPLVRYSFDPVLHLTELRSVCGGTLVLSAPGCVHGSKAAACAPPASRLVCISAFCHHGDRHSADATSMHAALMQPQAPRWHRATPAGAAAPCECDPGPPRTPQCAAPRPHKSRPSGRPWRWSACGPLPACLWLQAEHAAGVGKVRAGKVCFCMSVRAGERRGCTPSGMRTAGSCCAALTAAPQVLRAVRELLFTPGAPHGHRCTGGLTSHLATVCRARSESRGPLPDLRPPCVPLCRQTARPPSRPL